MEAEKCSFLVVPAWVALALAIVVFLLTEADRPFSDEDEAGTCRTWGQARRCVTSCLTWSFSDGKLRPPLPFNHVYVDDTSIQIAHCINRHRPSLADNRSCLFLINITCSQWHHQSIPEIVTTSNGQAVHDQ
ncbi:uncharacterized protein BDZ83DRAFT_123549 [Colletotrichum acutatum]|uniref:Secreted protein n=1 Tax=Glomerella acutata TaxID=27357 RepID=A0AAD8XCL9_GLOAC|nr:uncharacterized protein BDZ83DRAFT_123549 [Colletotrichum acutatum]KAK1710840.1 hypothetical protein BDZ83DRAFT_123549 [Colletotrichum acutatum]